MVDSGYALSSFNLILTKLYGGQGPVYLNVSLSKRLAIDLTLASNAVSWSRAIRKAAFMIILSPILHPREVGRPLLPGDLVLQSADVLVLALDLANRLIAIPQHLEPELELVLHLVEHVAERLGRRSQELDDVFARLEDGAERHRDDGVLPHDGFVDALVREDVFPRRVEHLERRVGDNGRQVLVVHRVDIRRIRADANGAEAQWVARLDDAVHVLAAADEARLGANRGAPALNRPFGGAAVGDARRLGGRFRGALDRRLSGGAYFAVPSRRLRLGRRSRSFAPPIDRGGMRRSPRA